jgi:signal transduction histidine kinase
MSVELQNPLPGRCTEVRPRLSRTTTFRLTVTYAAVLVIAVASLISLIYWQAAQYMVRQGDAIVRGQVRALLYVDENDLPDEIDRLQVGDLRGVIHYGLFSAQGRYLRGRVFSLPPGVTLDGKPQDWLEPGFEDGARAVAKRLPNEQILFVGYDAKTLAGLREIIFNSLWWSAALILVLGLMLGVVTGIGPLRRVRAVQVISQRIALGDLTQRLPISQRGDELDALSALVNQMIEEIGFLVDEVKSVGDNVAHDLRTPLNKLRSNLHRMLVDWSDTAEPTRQLHLEKSLAAADVLLARFRALQRIAEIDRNARQAGMARFQPAHLIERMFEDYQAVAEDSDISLSLELEAVPVLLADQELLAEALMNLLDNALKFTPAGGRVRMGLKLAQGGIRIEIEDNGPGIADDQRELVLCRFGRGQLEKPIEGSGLGLAIVAAVARAHDFSIRLEDANPGLRAVLQTRPISS